MQRPGGRACADWCVEKLFEMICPILFTQDDDLRPLANAQYVTFFLGLL